jgi:hypothetical protein
VANCHCGWLRSWKKQIAGGAVLSDLMLIGRAGRAAAIELVRTADATGTASVKSARALQSGEVAHPIHSPGLSPVAT